MSTTFDMSIMPAKESEGHSMNVSRCFFDVTMVSGPVGCESVCLVYLRTRDFMRVVFPTPGGPTTATTRGGGSEGMRSTSGT